MESNIHQPVLTDLARSFGECKGHASRHDLTPTLVTSHIQTRDQAAQDAEEEEEEERVFMVRSHLFVPPLSVGASLSNVSDCAVQHWIRRTTRQPFGHSVKTIPVLIDILEDLPHIDLNLSLAWGGNYWIYIASFWVRAHDYDESRLGITRPTSLLQLTNHYPRFGKSIGDAVVEFSATVVEKIQSFILRPKIWIFPRGDLHLWQTEALHQKKRSEKVVEKVNWLRTGS